MPRGSQDPQKVCCWELPEQENPELPGRRGEAGLRTQVMMVSRSPHAGSACCCSVLHRIHTSGLLSMQRRCPGSRGCVARGLRSLLVLQQMSMRVSCPGGALAASLRGGGRCSGATGPALSPHRARAQCRPVFRSTSMTVVNIDVNGHFAKLFMGIPLFLNKILRRTISIVTGLRSQ